MTAVSDAVAVSQLRCQVHVLALAAVACPSSEAASCAAVLQLLNGPVGPVVAAFEGYCKALATKDTFNGDPDGFRFSLPDDERCSYEWTERFIEEDVKDALDQLLALRQ